jgi:hypothetical protein
MGRFYPKVSQIGVNGYRSADAFPNGSFIYREIMFVAFDFLYIDDFQTVPLKYDLGLQGVSFFPPNNTLFDLLSGGLGDFP